MEYNCAVSNIIHGHHHNNLHGGAVDMINSHINSNSNINSDGSSHSDSNGNSNSAKEINNNNSNHEW